MFKMASPAMPALPNQPTPAPPLQPTTQKPEAKSGNPTFLGAMMAPTQSQTTSGTKSLLGQ